ncbi:MAG: hypothetical protein NVSMB19_17070 [Vulcanimicrobiaceae bacterium]
MFDFLRSLFSPPPPSGTTAKERLRLVLLSDHLSLAPDVVEALKKDLLAVISRYVTIDSAHADVTFEHRENEVAMLANIPITGVRERTASPPPPVPATVSAESLAPPVPVPSAAEPAGPAPVEPAQPAAAHAPASAPGKPATRRRRRKKAPNALANAAERKVGAEAQPGYSAQA